MTLDLIIHETAYPVLRRAILPTFPLSVFYRPTPTAIEVFRVLHHARDLDKTLANLRPGVAPCRRRSGCSDTTS